MANLELVPRPSSPPIAKKPKTVAGWIAWGAYKGPTAVASAVVATVAKVQGESFVAKFQKTVRAIDDHVGTPIVDFADRHNAALLTGAALGAGGAVARHVGEAESDKSAKKIAQVGGFGAVAGVAGAAFKASMEEGMPPPAADGQEPFAV